LTDAPVLARFERRRRVGAGGGEEARTRVARGRRGRPPPGRARRRRVGGAALERRRRRRRMLGARGEWETGVGGGGAAEGVARGRPVRRKPCRPGWSRRR
jgi:hypothetical protein